MTASVEPSVPYDPRFVRMPRGLYRTVMDLATFERMQDLQGLARIVHEEMDPAEAAGPLLLHVAKVLRWRLDRIATDAASLNAAEGGLSGSAREDAVRRIRLAHQVSLVNALVAAIRQDAIESGRAADLPGGLLDPIATHELLAISESESIPRRPDTPLDQHWLLAAGPFDPSLQSQLAVELESADQLDIICSFVKFSGVRLLKESLEKFCSRPSVGGPRLRLLTTTYMGATDARAVEYLASLPNTEVLVSFDGSRTRLHAKGYVFRRATGFGSAYVGSANISRAALTEGHEWVVKIAQASSPDLWDRIEATFESFWNSPAFERFDPGDPQAAARLREALRIESAGDSGAGTAADDLSFSGFELRPYPFQQEVLDRLAVEREVLGRDRHLVVAATGTGKTMIAAFDYRSVCERSAAEGRPRPRLLFVAHQEQILRQALATFRHVLRDFNFADLLVGGHGGGDGRNLFASIQSIRATGLLDRIEPDGFDYVVIDEAHHGEAPTYRSLIDFIRPRTLLGLTGTPERADGLDIFQHFGHRPSAEIRLPDAIDRRLLSPFQYFVISDETVDLTDVRFQGGKFDRRQLEQRFIGNESRASLVAEKVQEICTSPGTIRAIGFCASIAHAEFMADRFESYGFRSVCLTGQTPKDRVREAVQELRRGELRVIFTVDLFNEGVDIPEVDTILLLRPTESLTVFLQQLGRGLRLSEGKECLTVLDFVSQVAKNYRFESRFRALLSGAGASLQREIEQSFPSVPVGCAIRMERVAQEVILANVLYHQRDGVARLVSELQWQVQDTGAVPSLDSYLTTWGRSAMDLYQRCTWTELKHRAGLGPAVSDPFATGSRSAKHAASGLLRLSHIDDPAWIDDSLGILDEIASGEGPRGGDPRRRAMLHRSLWSRTDRQSVEDATRRLAENPQLASELRELLEHRRERIESPNPPLGIQGPCSLRVHAHYTRDEVMLGLGLGTLEDPKESREGVFRDGDHQRYLMFVTLTKTEERFSPTTMYHDYAISEQLFHWQSQSTTSQGSPTGQMLINHRAMGVQLLLFVRDHAKVDGVSMPFMFLGSADTVHHSGSNPMNLTLRLAVPMPAVLYRYARRA